MNAPLFVCSLYADFKALRVSTDIHRKTRPAFLQIENITDVNTRVRNEYQHIINIIHLLPSLEASPSGDMNFLGETNLRVSRLTGQLIVCYTESCSTTLYSAERCVVRHDRGNTTSGRKHDDLFSHHVTSLDQSYFFIRHINYIRYNNMHLLPS